MKRTVTIDAPSRSIRPRISSSRRSGKYAGKGQIYKSLKGTPNGIHQFRKVAETRVLVTDLGFAIGATRSTVFSIQFNLTQFSFSINNTGASQNGVIPGYNEISALFDQVMLDNVVVKIWMLADPAAVPANAVGGQAPLMYHCVDFNDAIVPVDQSVVNQYGNQKSKVMCVENGPIVRTIRPKFAQVVYASALGSSYRAQRGYLQSFVDVPHYGMKGAITVQSGGSGTTTQSYCIVEVAYTYNAKNTI